MIELKLSDHDEYLLKIMAVRTVYTIDHKATGAILRAERAKTNLTLRDMAKLIGWSAAYVCDLENGNRNWTPQKVKKYMKIILRMYKEI